VSACLCRYTEDASAFKPLEIGRWDEAVEKITRKPRADAARNRERVLEAAKVVFSAGGAEASLEAVARAAGVGIGTLYRISHARSLVRSGCTAAKCNTLPIWPTVATRAQPIDALRHWMRSNVKVRCHQKGMLAALALAADKNSNFSHIRSIS